MLPAGAGSNRHSRAAMSSRPAVSGGVESVAQISSTRIRRSSNATGGSPSNRIAGRPVPSQPVTTLVTPTSYEREADDGQVLPAAARAAYARPQPAMNPDDQTRYALELTR